MEESVIDAGMIVREALALKREVEPVDGKKENAAIGGGSRDFEEPAYSCKPSLGFSKAQTFLVPLVDVAIESKRLRVPQEELQSR